MYSSAVKSRRSGICFFTGAIATIAWQATAAFSAVPVPASAPTQEEIVTEATAQTFERNYILLPDAMIEISNVRGSVKITGGEGDQVQLSGTLGSQSRLKVNADPRYFALHVESTHSGWFGGSDAQGDTMLVLSVPHGTAIKLDLVSANGSVDGIDGKSLEINDVSGTLRIHSDAHSVDIDSVSGAVTLQATRIGAVEHAHVQTVSGSIDAKDLNGSVKLETVSGAISFGAGNVKDFRAESVSGAISISTAPAKSGRFHTETMSGGVHVRFPSDLSGRLHAETFSGSLRSDFGSVSKTENGPGSKLDARLGDGDARIEAQSFSGDVELRKQ